jgi:uncharacterized protein
MNAKLEQLKALLKSYESVAVGFSGDRAFGVIGRSPTYPKRELEEAIRLATTIGARFEIVDTCEMDNPSFTENSPSRCFFCKSNLFEIIHGIAKKHGLKTMLEGSNADDTLDYRPGMEAAKKLGVKAPLLEVGLTKTEIRLLSKEMGLDTWNKPSMACLSSRIPYGETITVERLSRIEKAEAGIRELGLGQVRVRDHGDVARIEIEPSRIAEVAADGLRAKIAKAVKAAGYRYICLDLEGYRTGAMNEAIGKKASPDVSR